MAIQTTAGEVEAGDLGFTSMHEHVACWFSGFVRDNYLWDPRSDARELALAEAVRKVSAGREAGIDTIVDLTTVDIGRDVPFIAEVSKRTGVSVIVTAGLFARSPPGSWNFFHVMGEEKTAELMTRDIEVGVMGTDVKAGVIKAAHAPPLIANIKPEGLRAMEELKVLPKWMWGEFGLRVAALTHRRTGALINVHTHSPTRSGLITCDILEDGGVDLSRVLIHHVGNTDDMDYLHAMLDRGANLSMDPHHGAWHYATIAQLCAEGFADRLTLGIDSVQIADWDPILEFEGEQRARYELEWAIEYLPLSVVPNLKAAGVSDQAIDAMTRANPARMLEFATKTAAPADPVRSPVTEFYRGPRPVETDEHEHAEAAPAPALETVTGCGPDCGHEHH